jgi:hypothetical protein
MMQDTRGWITKGSAAAWFIIGLMMVASDMRFGWLLLVFSFFFMALTTNPMGDWVSRNTKLMMLAYASLSLLCLLAAALCLLLSSS